MGKRKSSENEALLTTIHYQIKRFFRLKQFKKESFEIKMGILEEVLGDSLEPIKDLHLPVNLIQQQVRAIGKELKLGKIKFSGRKLEKFRKTICPFAFSFGHTVRKLEDKVSNESYIFKRKVTLSGGTQAPNRRQKKAFEAYHSREDGPLTPIIRHRKDPSLEKEILAIKKRAESRRAKRLPSSTIQRDVCNSTRKRIAALLEKSSRVTVSLVDCLEKSAYNPCSPCRVQLNRLEVDEAQWVSERSRDASLTRLSPVSDSSGYVSKKGDDSNISSMPNFSDDEEVERYWLRNSPKRRRSSARIFNRSSNINIRTNRTTTPRHKQRALRLQQQQRANQQQKKRKYMYQRKKKTKPKLRPPTSDPEKGEDYNYEELCFSGPNGCDPIVHKGLATLYIPRWDRTIDDELFADVEEVDQAEDYTNASPSLYTYDHSKYGDLGVMDIIATIAAEHKADG